jgi:hypothetical protein
MPSLLNLCSNSRMNTFHMTVEMIVTRTYLVTQSSSNYVWLMKLIHVLFIRVMPERTTFTDMTSLHRFFDVLLFAEFRLEQWFHLCRYIREDRRLSFTRNWGIFNKRVGIVWPIVVLLQMY